MTECTCPHCDATTADPEAEYGWGRSDDGEWYCPDCLGYSTTEARRAAGAVAGAGGELDARIKAALQELARSR